MNSTNKATKRTKKIKEASPNPPRKTPRNNSIFFTAGEKLESYSLANQFAEHLEFSLVKDKTNATAYDVFQALAKSVRDRLVRNWLRTRDTYRKIEPKKVNYLSLEFLMGRLLGNALININRYDESWSLLKQLGYTLEDIREQEHDMGLGNGGLGRLAACFLDSLATLEYPAYGYGLRYEFGIFEQDIQNGYQVENPDSWLALGNPWELIRPDHSHRVKFGGSVAMETDDQGALKFKWENTEDITATAYDIPIPGYRNHTVNILRLWQARATRDFNLQYFNRGNYLAAVEQKFNSETISKVLYPNDQTSQGKLLRLKQQYFFVSATIQDILTIYKQQEPSLEHFAEKNAIQLNDTHPTLAIPELMRLLIDEEGFGWDRAWEITTATFGYTNHTVLPEALETWPVGLLQPLLPRHYQIICEINQRFLESVRAAKTCDDSAIERLSIFKENGQQEIRMANLAIVGSHSVNGVARLHTEILKNELFHDFYQCEPGKFFNCTNGITQRRWLTKANPFLAKAIMDRLGADFNLDLEVLRGLEKYSSNPEFQTLWQEARWINKQSLAKYAQSLEGIRMNVDSLFDTHVKRFHEYKRQLLNVLHVITLYTRMKMHPDQPHVPRTVIFGGKAAPGYDMAKLIIKLINSVAQTINNDPEVKNRLSLYFFKNYSVSLAERIIPASDLSEQISTAGYEASGTGNMKFALNGALTIGTMDGATIEMAEEIGRENMFIFGLSAEEVRSLRHGGYQPEKYYEENPELHLALNMIRDNYFNPNEPGLFAPIFNALVHGGDQYCLLADYAPYIKAQSDVEETYRNKPEWIRKSILNTARMGKFSSDRAIQEYAKFAWDIKPVKIELPEEERITPL
ncbi:MAG: glycogen/starch/alpha-glucan phosphorylase [Ignavibacteriae bacterium]|nr:MAG: glycogen/starch/alpha-glucan phosphorylase [Ignavibacteriota bacterium]